METLYVTLTTDIILEYIREQDNYVLPPRKYANLNKLQLKLLSRDYTCATIMEEIKYYIRYGLNNPQDIDINDDLLTGLKVMSTESVEGIVMTGGIQYIDDMIAVKQNKSSDVNTDILAKHEFVVGDILNSLRSETNGGIMYTYAIKECMAVDDDLHLKTGDTKICIGTTPKVYTFLEYVSGAPLKDAIADMTPTEVGKVILCVMCILDIASKVKFCHYDLHSGNIMIRTLKKPRTLQYTLSDGGIVIVETRHIPTIIDFGFARIEHNNIVYSKVNLESYKMVLNTQDRENFPHLVGEGYYPICDFYKFFSGILGGIHKTVYYMDSGELTEEWYNLINCLTQITQQFSHCPLEAYFNQFIPTISKNGQNKIVMDVSTNITFGKRYPESVYWEYPVDDIIDIVNSMYGTTIMTYDDKCLPAVEVTNLLYPDVPVCNEESIKKYGFESSILTCSHLVTLENGVDLIEVPEGTTMYSGNRNVVKNNKSVDHQNLQIMGTLQSAKQWSAFMDVYDNSFKCGQNCVSVYNTTSRLKILNIVDPASIARFYVAIPENLKLQFLQFCGYKGKNTVDAVYKFFELLTFVDTPLISASGDIYNEYLKNSENIQKEIQILTKGSKLTTFLDHRANKKELADSRRKSYNEILRKYNNIAVSQATQNKRVLPIDILVFLQTSAFHGYCIKYNEIIVLPTVLQTHFARDIYNLNDWQYTDIKYVYGNMGKLVEYLKTVETRTSESESLYEKSVWCALYMHHRLKMSKVPLYVPNFNRLNRAQQSQSLAIYTKIAILSAFLYPFLLTRKPDISDTSKLTSTINSLLRVYNFETEDINTIIFIIQKTKGVDRLLAINNPDEGTPLLDQIDADFTATFSNPQQRRSAVMLCLHIAGCYRLSKKAYSEIPNKETITESIIENPNLTLDYFNDFNKTYPFISNVPGTKDIPVNLTRIHKQISSIYDFVVQYYYTKGSIVSPDGPSEGVISSIVSGISSLFSPGVSNTENKEFKEFKELTAKFNNFFEYPLNFKEFNSDLTESEVLKNMYDNMYNVLYAEKIENGVSPNELQGYKFKNYVLKYLLHQRDMNLDKLLACEM